MNLTFVSKTQKKWKWRFIFDNNRRTTKQLFIWIINQRCATNSKAEIYLRCFSYPLKNIRFLLFSKHSMYSRAILFFAWPLMSTIYLIESSVSFVLLFLFDSSFIIYRKKPQLKQSVYQSTIHMRRKAASCMHVFIGCWNIFHWFFISLFMFLCI